MPAEGRRHRTPRLDISWKANELGHPRFGLVVPKYGRTAVQRNLVRRRIREAARKEVLPVIPKWDVVVRARPGAYRAGGKELIGDLGRWLESSGE